MSFLLDFLPILLFFATYKFAGIYVATSVAIVASVLQILYYHFVHHRVETLHWITMILIVILGGTTLLLHNELFIKWKPTAINWAFALTFLSSEFIGKKNVSQRLLDNNVNLPETIWKRLNYSWVIFFILMGMANLYVIYHYDTDTWVNFKLFGVLGLTLLFVILQALYLARHIKEPTEK